MTVECMHCKTIIGEKPGYGVQGVSSGICKACVRTYYPDLADRLLEIKEETIGGEPT